MFADLFNEADDASAQDSGTAFSSARIKMPKPPAPRGDGGFVGLQNQGSTCYMNALLQVMYMTPELRDGLFRVDPGDLGFAEVMDAEKEEKAAVAEVAEKSETAASRAPPPIEVDENLLQTLMDMGFEEHGSRRALASTKGNGGMDAALNYYLEHSEDAGFLDPPAQVAAAVGSGKGGVSKKKKKPRVIPLELQRLFTQLQHLDIYAQSTTDLTSKGFQWQGMDGRVQHDAHELNRLLLDALEKSLKHTSGEKLCSSLYRGELANRIKCLQCGIVKDRCEEYFDLMTQVLGCPDLASSMRAYLAAELLDGPNAYACEICGAKCPAHKGTVISAPLPPIMTFSLQRFDIDRRSWERVKVKSTFEFPLALNMGHFIEGSGANKLNAPISTDPEVEAKILREVRGGMLWLSEAVAAAMLFATDRVGQHLTAENTSILTADSVETRANEIVAQISDPEWACVRNSLMGQYAAFGADADTFIYELFAVITHCGSAYSGHYFAYIRDCFSSGKWKMPQPKNGVRDGTQVVTASADPNNTKTSTVPQDQFRERSRAEITGDKGPTQARFVVNSDSPLGLLIRIILEEGSELDKEFILTNEHANDTPTYMPIGKIGSAVKKHIKRTWKESFNIGMTEFIRKVPEDLICYLNSKESFVVWDISTIEFVDAVTFVNAAHGRSTTALYADGSNDEAIAVALQKQLDGEAGAAVDGAIATGKVDPESSDWEVVGDKKKTVPDINMTEKSAVAEEVAATGAAAEALKEEEDAFVAAKLTLVDHVANLVLNATFGEYWEFNDSSVSPICLSTIAKAFEATNSAYILVYRSKATGPGKDGKFLLPEAPPSWLEVVNAENASLEGQRAEYEEYVLAANAGTVDICVRCPVHMGIDLVGGALLASKQCSHVPEMWKDGLYVRCTNATTIDDLKIFIADQIGNSTSSAFGVELSVQHDSVDLGTAKSVVSTPAWGSGSEKLKSKMAAVGKNISLPSGPSAAFVSVLAMKGGGIGWYPTEALELVAAKNEIMKARRGEKLGIHSSAPLSYSQVTVGDILGSVSASASIPLTTAMFPTEASSKDGKICILSATPPAEESVNNAKYSPARTLALNLLLWNENMIDGRMIQTGPSHEPRLFAVKFLVPGNSSVDVPASLSTDSFHVRPVVLWSCEMWINSSVDVAALCDRMTAWVSTMLSKYPDQLRRYSDKSSSSPLSVYVIETYGSLQNQPKAHAKGIYSKLLYDGETKSMVRAVKKDSTAKDLQGSELTVEFSLPTVKKGMSGNSLSEVEVTFRNNEIEISFEFDDKLIRSVQQWPSPAQESNQDEDVARVNSAVSAALAATKVAVDFTQTLGELKKKMLTHLCMKALNCLDASPTSTANGNGGDVDAMGESILNLCINELMDQVRIKLNPDLAGIMSDEHIDEKKGVSSTLKSGDVLYLELGVPVAVGSITLQCIPVFGNDVAIKRNPLQSGYRAAHLKLEQTFSITKDSDVSIEDVRLSFLHAMNELISIENGSGGRLSTAVIDEGETISSLDALNTRLRTTNWCEEAAEMPLAEITTANRTPLLLSSVVTSGLLKSKSLLHLEMGKPPLPGMIELEIFIDTSEMALFSSSHDSTEDAQSASLLSTLGFNAAVGLLQCDLDMPLIDLQAAVLGLCQTSLPDIYRRRMEAAVAVAGGAEQDLNPEQLSDFPCYGARIPESMENFVLREMGEGADNMPGRCLWVRGGPLVPPSDAEPDSSDVTAAVAVIQSAADTFASRSSKKPTPNKRVNGKSNKSSFASSLVTVETPAATVTKSTIRRVKLASGSRKLVVQLLPVGATHSSSIPGEGAMKLWVYRSRLISDQPKEKEYLPEGMPADILLNAGPMPSLPQLKRVIERELDIPFHSQRIFKLFETDNMWKDIESLSEKRKKTNPKGSDNLLSVPYLFKEGTVLCVVHVGDTKPSTAFGVVATNHNPVTYSVDRPIDELRRAKDAAGPSAGGERGKKKRRNQQEIGLRLAGDFDFSEDEDTD